MVEQLLGYEQLGPNSYGQMANALADISAANRDYYHDQAQQTGQSQWLQESMAENQRRFWEGYSGISNPTIGTAPKINQYAGSFLDMMTRPGSSRYMSRYVDPSFAAKMYQLSGGVPIRNYSMTNTTGNAPLTGDGRSSVYDTYNRTENVGAGSIYDTHSKNYGQGISLLDGSGISRDFMPGGHLYNPDQNWTGAGRPYLGFRGGELVHWDQTRVEDNPWFRMRDDDEPLSGYMPSAVPMPDPRALTPRFDPSVPREPDWYEGDGDPGRPTPATMPSTDPESQIPTPVSRRASYDWYMKGPSKQGREEAKAKTAENQQRELDLPVVPDDVRLWTDEDRQAVYEFDQKYAEWAKQYGQKSAFDYLRQELADKAEIKRKAQGYDKMSTAEYLKRFPLEFN
jgi:hypothetical protein